MEVIMSNTERHYGEIYRCRRTRLLEELQQAGFKYFKVVPEYPSGYLNWLFVNSPELEAWLQKRFHSEQN